MTIEDVRILNWQSPGSIWWSDREAKPDEADSIHAVMTIKMSFREYTELLRQHRTSEVMLTEREKGASK